ncbi:MAG: hypothetical protein QOK23_2209 [Gammaproteobacteria bacterium]|jgi:hypothetical protein|nr:hypothetical protein [Gammaproteobacteria bacterium]
MRAISRECIGRHSAKTANSADQKYKPRSTHSRRAVSLSKRSRSIIWINCLRFASAQPRVADLQFEVDPTTKQVALDTANDSLGRAGLKTIGYITNGFF